MLCGRCGSCHYSAAASQEKDNRMSSIKNLLFQMMEEDHERAIKQRNRELFGEFTEEQKEMARYDHISSDAREESEDEE